MRIHLIKTDEVGEGRYRDILVTLQGFPGPMAFVHRQPELRREMVFCEVAHPIPPLEGTEEENRRVKELGLDVQKWEDLFERCREYRYECDVGDDEHVVLLTDQPNDKNWFSAMDPGWKNDFFVHTAFWDLLVQSEEKYPIIYEIIANLLQKAMFRNFEDLLEHVHEKPRGCLNDLCQDKRDIIQKIRTGDICPDCLEAIHTRRVSPRIMEQSFRIIDAIRTRMLFRQRYFATLRPSRLLVKGYVRDVYLTDMASLKVPLTPLEKVVFLFFLKHPEGVFFHALSDHRQELIDIYGRVSGEGTLTAINNNIDRLIDLNEPSLSEKLSKIKRTFIHLLGEEMAKHYYVTGKIGGLRGIRLDRMLVEYGE